jgi:hypothetical protein
LLLTARRCPSGSLSEWRWNHDANGVAMAGGRLWMVLWDPLPPRPRATTHGRLYWVVSPRPGGSVRLRRLSSMVSVALQAVAGCGR